MIEHLQLALTLAYEVQAHMEASYSETRNVEAVVREYFADAPTMIEVARCESTFRQFDEKGHVLKGIKNPKDKGTFQINETYHLADSQKLGFDIETLEGNLGYARHLYETQGLKPWGASKPCWSKPQGEKAVA
jgi:hypothetical protein